MGADVGDSINRPPSKRTPKPRVQVLYELFRDDVRERIQGLGLRGADLDELVQIVYTVANRRVAVIPRNDEAAKRWLMEVARKQVSNFRRLYRHGYEILDPGAIARAAAQPEDTEGHRATIALVQAAMRLMPADERELLLRHDVEGESLHDIARWLGLKKSGAHVRLQQARVRLAEKIKRVETQKKGRRRRASGLPAIVSGLADAWGWLWRRPQLLVAVGFLALLFLLSSKPEKTPPRRRKDATEQDPPTNVGGLAEPAEWGRRP